MYNLQIVTASSRQYEYSFWLERLVSLLRSYSLVRRGSSDKLVGCLESRSCLSFAHLGRAPCAGPSGGVSESVEASPRFILESLHWLDSASGFNACGDCGDAAILRDDSTIRCRYHLPRLNTSYCTGSRDQVSDVVETSPCFALGNEQWMKSTSGLNLRSYRREGVSLREDTTNRDRLWCPWSNSMYAPVFWRFAGTSVASGSGYMEAEQREAGGSDIFENGAEILQHRET